MNVYKFYFTFIIFIVWPPPGYGEEEQIELGQVDRTKCIGDEDWILVRIFFIFTILEIFNNFVWMQNPGKTDLD